MVLREHGSMVEDNSSTGWILFGNLHQRFWESFWSYGTDFMAEKTTVCCESSIYFLPPFHEAGLERSNQ